MSENNPHAFPSETSATTFRSGMTLRDYFAAKALTTRSFTVRPYDICDEVAKDCYRMADAMLKVRNAAQ